MGVADRIGKGAEGAFGMSNEVWMRHANPWSGWTRVIVLPLLTLAIWSRVWIGWWCLLPIAALMAWTWINPRAFPPPARTDNWMSKAVFGERVWLNREAVPIPRRHVRTLAILTLLGLPGIPAYIYGLWILDLGWTLLGGAYATVVKFWFLDRCVWLYEDMKDQHAPYAAWLRSGNDG